ncbi:MAG TPA: HepT-like ribonuclease domain-containing protein [Thermomicrobiales bacterium]|nr:HepT-like ribonuclease domain-containing protein [Thermomicrobiales bacterium]
MDLRTRKLLRDALGAADEILEYTQDIDFTEFASDRMRQRATFYALAILGEALNLVTKHAPELKPEIRDYRLAVDMRNRLIHGYESVDIGIVWATVRAEVPNLKDELQEILDAD